MEITSIFKHNEAIPSRFTCDGEDINPPLSFSDIPESAKSLVLIVDDPDAVPEAWTHWVVVNIKPEIKNIDESSVPSGSLQTMTSFGKAGWGGPCPPAGEHRYLFKLYALDIGYLNVGSASTVEEVAEAMAGHIIGNAELIGLYKRK